MKPILLFLCAFSLTLQAQTDPLSALKSEIASDYPYLHDLYIHCHTHPELSFYEFNTSQRMAEELRHAGYEVTEKVGGNGVVGVLKNGEGPTILIRADMDALPIAEETGLPYASTVTATDESGKTVGVMHACGHDIHMTVWTGTARAMASMRDQWSGTLVFIGQPAEERSGGSKEMLKDGLYERFPHPDYGLALHVNSNLPAGTVGLCPGYAMANVDMVDITVHGKGGHGALPHQTLDPVVLSARIILALQTIVSRELPPSEPGVLTVGSIHGGSKGNVIPDEVKMELTLRSYTDEVRNAMIEKLTRICNGEAMAAGLPEAMYPTIKVRDEYTPALYNDPDLTKIVGKAFSSAVGNENVVDVPPNMVGEDFGRFGRTEPRVPILQYWLGSVDPQKVETAKASGTGLPSLHSSKYIPLPEPTIKTGVLTMSAALLELLK
ncbi:MAG: amidohydrolase [Saprospirales bacterium]|nr:amidohydrolase [Saprospirales bacterium]